jgi:hypothetical protein
MGAREGGGLGMLGLERLRFESVLGTIGIGGVRDRDGQGEAIPLTARRHLILSSERGVNNGEASAFGARCCRELGVIDGFDDDAEQVQAGGRGGH